LGSSSRRPCSGIARRPQPGATRSVPAVRLSGYACHPYKQTGQLEVPVSGLSGHRRLQHHRGVTARRPSRPLNGRRSQRRLPIRSASATRATHLRHTLCRRAPLGWLRRSSEGVHGCDQTISPEPCAQVRILPGAPCMRCPKTPSPAETLRPGSSRMRRRKRPRAAVCRAVDEAWTGS
jgi:hypothetical protein